MSKKLFCIVFFYCLTPPFISHVDVLLAGVQFCSRKAGTKNRNRTTKQKPKRYRKKPIPWRCRWRHRDRAGLPNSISLPKSNRFRTTRQCIFSAQQIGSQLSLHLFRFLAFAEVTERNYFQLFFVVCLETSRQLVDS